MISRPLFTVLHAWLASFLLIQTSFICCSAQSTPGTSKPSETTGTAGADTVTFMNGDRVTGKLVAATTDTVMFTGNATGSIALKWADIDHITTSKPLEVSSTGADIVVAAGATLRMNATNLVIDRGTDGMTAVPVASFVAATPTEPPASAAVGFIRNWGAVLQMQDNVIQATQKQYQFGGTLHAGRETRSRVRWKHQTTSFNLQANYSDSLKPKSSPVITSLYTGGIEHHLYIDSRGSTYLYVLADAYHNSSLGMRTEQEYGGGIGWKKKTKHQSFGVSGDLRYLNEDLYLPGKGFESAAVGMTENYEYRFPWPKKGPPIAFSERILALPAISQAKAFQARAFARIDVPLNDKFSIGIQQIDDFLRNAPLKTNQNYAGTQMTLKYTFGVVPQ